jgi:hypothetical protein
MARIVLESGDLNPVESGSSVFSTHSSEHLDHLTRDLGIADDTETTDVH